MDFSKLHNPFDFANPVIDPKLFAGRKSELEDIEYYLNHAKSAPRAINLALIGDRASGKTSLLNMIEAGAKQRGFCTVRVDLDESDVETQLVFFLKLFDGIFTAACKDGAFGGIQGKTYDTYRSMIDAYEIPDDRTFCPFVFPMQYAKAMGNGNTTAPVSDVYKDDISLIHAELKKPIAILVDECDVLTHSRVHLEKLRNIFMNISGFFLVFTGTGAFFPLINDVFSPIIRQFKKISVKPFESEKETKDCIEKPLRGLGIKTQELFDFETYREIESIHNLSGGRPYEIQLICHQLFRRVQTGKATRLQLSVDVLDDVLMELQSLQDVNSRPIIQKIRELSKEEMRAMNVLLWGNKLVTFEQAWYVEHVFNSDSVWTKEKLKEVLDKLVFQGLISIENGLLSFLGDDFDRLYCKYFSRKQKASVNINEFSFEMRTRIALDIQIRRNLKYVKMDRRPFRVRIDELEIETVVESFCNHEIVFFDNNPELGEALYCANLENQDLTTFPFVYLQFNTPWDRINTWYIVDGAGDDFNADTCLSDFENAFKDINARALENGSYVAIKVFNMPVIPLDVIATKVLALSNQKLKTNLSKFHLGEMIEAYTSDVRDLEDAKYHGELALQLCPEHEDMQTMNNMGYLFMALGNVEKAKDMFEAALRKNKALPFDPLPLFEDDINEYWSGMLGLVNYNLGIIHAMNGDYGKAKDYIYISIKEAENLNDHECECLFVPQIVTNKLEFVEVLKPNLLATAKTGIETIEKYESNKKINSW